MIVEFNQEGTKQKYTYQKQLTNQNSKTGLDYSARIHFKFLPPVVTVNCDNQKVVVKKLVQNEAVKVKN